MSDTPIGLILIRPFGGGTIMALDLQVGDDHWRIGSADLLHAFFSTISERLEPHGWGTRFPALMDELYQGELSPTRVETALSELLLARRELGRRFAGEDGRDLFDVLLAALMRLRTVASGSLRIVDGVPYDRAFVVSANT